MTRYICRRCGKTMKTAGRGGYGPTCAIYVLGPPVDGRTQSGRKERGRRVKREDRKSADNRQLPLELEVRT